MVIHSLGRSLLWSFIGWVVPCYGHAYVGSFLVMDIHSLGRSLLWSFIGWVIHSFGRS